MRGVHTALVTPFTASGDIDVVAFERLAERQIAGGVHGLVPCGTTGEAPTLTDEEWKHLVSAAIGVADKRVPVTVGVGTNNTRTTIAKCEKAASFGADMGLLVLPYYNKPNPHGLRAHVIEATRAGLPLVLYHVPGRTGQRIAPEQLAELANLDGIVGIKEATGDVRYGTDVVALTKRPVLSGDDFTFLGLLSQGGAGVISVISDVDPAGTVAVYEHFAAGRAAEATAAMLRIWKLCAFLFADTNPVPTKAALAEMGLCRADVRLPLGAYRGPSCRPLLAELGLV